MTKKIIIPLFIILCVFSVFYFEAFSRKISDLQPTQSTQQSTAQTTRRTTYKAVVYSNELQGAYDYAYGIGITTQTSIQNADMYGNLIRAHMAKMMVNYAKEVLGKTPKTSIQCDFTDIWNQTEEMKGYIIEACQMGLMGVGITEFNPDGVVTRAEFGTVLDRALTDTSNDGGSPYYSRHLDSLKEIGIMNDISNPDVYEQRGLVMLMMQRGDKGGSNLNICTTPSNTLSCSLGLRTCPAQCWSGVSNGIIQGPNNEYEVNIYDNGWVNKKPEYDTEQYRFLSSNNNWLQIFYYKYSTYNTTTLEGAINDTIASNKKWFSSYKLLESTTKYIHGKDIGVIKQLVNVNGQIGIDVIYVDENIKFNLYITYSSGNNTDTQITDDIIDSIKINSTDNENCNPGTEHKEDSICVSNTRSCIGINSQGTQTWTYNSRGSCVISSCDYGYTMQYGSCVSNSRSCYIYNGSGQQTLVNGVWGSCFVSSCKAGYSNVNNQCLETQTQSCSITNGQGQQVGTRSSSYGSWNRGSCNLISCNAGYTQNGNYCSLSAPSCNGSQHLEGSTCIENSRSCSITNGIGQQTWDGSNRGSCNVVSCGSGYNNIGNTCSL